MRLLCGRSVAYLDLGLGHAQGVGQLGALGPRQVLGLLERLLQREDLLAAERGPRVLLLAVLVRHRRHCNTYTTVNDGGQHYITTIVCFVAKGRFLE